MEMFLVVVLTLCGIVNQASGHGRMMEPVARASAWRLGFPTPKNYDDNALWCGGFARKQANGGMCGVCGDPWNGRHDNEAGGRFATGTIVKTYKMGQVITTKVDITANHFGWMEYRICPNNDVTKPVTHDCLNKHVLQRADGKGSKVMIDSKRTGTWAMDYVLPVGMTCTQCVIQWKYHAGNSWGVDADTGRGCIGCGPQEEFYGCADVAILGDSPLPRVTNAPTAAPTQPPTPKPTTRAPVHITQRVTTQRPVIVRQTTPREFIGAKTVGCVAINNWKGDPQMDKWCTDNCQAGNCPVYACDCSQSVVTTQKPATPKPTTTPRPTTTPTTTTSTTTPTTTRKTTTTSTTTTPRPTPKPTTPKAVTQAPQGTTTNPLVHVVDRVECKAVNLWAGNEYLDRWCADACAHGNCPADQCACVHVQRLVTETTTTTEQPEPQTTTQKPLVVPTTKVCTAINVWKGIHVFDIWCTEECNKNNCPPETCVCTDTPLLPAKTTIRPTPTSPAPTTTSSTTTTTTTRKPDVTSYTTCISNGVVGGDYWNGWCQNHCDGGFCPIDYCECR